MNKILKLLALYRHKEKFVNESKQCDCGHGSSQW